MKTQYVTLSGKYQVVIPKTARKKLGLDKTVSQRFRVKSVTNDEITFIKDKSLDDFLGLYGHAFPKNATTKLRITRDNEWQE